MNVSNKLNIVFAGTPEFGVGCLQALHNSIHTLQAIYTQPDRPAGRGRKLQASAIKEWALKNHISIHQPLNFKDPQTISELAALKPDVMVVMAYGLILPRAVLEIPRLGCVNVHASLLPRWRGASPIQSAILQGDTKSGVTIMQMDAGLDTGPMLKKVNCAISSVETAQSLHDKLAGMAAQPLLQTLDELATEKAQISLQNDEFATYAKKINKDDAAIDWHQSAIEIDRKIRAFNPWPIAYAHLKEEIVRIHQAQVIPLQSQQTPGTSIRIDKKGILVATGEQGLLIERIQFPGAKVISIADWLNSSKTQIYSGLCFQ
jgi:methionyl-tRNA formyltransferase